MKLFVCCLLAGALGPGHAYVSDADLSSFMTQLWRSDVNGLSRASLGLQLQGKVYSSTSRDAAPAKLFGAVTDSVLRRSTYASFVQLLDNYVPVQGTRDQLDSSHRTEARRFLSNVLNTAVGNQLTAFLTSKGLVSGGSSGVSAALYDLWFWQYSRARGVWDSSGFEHVFVGEKKSDGREVGGLHNWIRFMLLERAGALNYWGYYSYKEPGVLKMRFRWGSAEKPVSSMLLGTSPELEMSVYSLCALARPNARCNFSVNGKPLSIRTYLISYFRDKSVIGSAFPDI